jgi:hypothetical protein
MPPNGTDFPSSAIEVRIQELVDRDRTLTFTALAAAMHDCRWITLFRALNHLEKQHVIRLIPLPWDYQIRRATSTNPAMRKG